ncbi:conserved domain protein [Bacteroides fluxus YIT 12057]|uniref:Conserved domain protein n=1 Tax=Bacteroides fluxus YIT 12057 TaxID=763034 RepID=F3PRK3_9BACE|nr:conserved domain protein [Bacteroides fluxus YIT 12057]
MCFQMLIMDASLGVMVLFTLLFIALFVKNESKCSFIYLSGNYKSIKTFIIYLSHSDFLSNFTR